MNIGEYIETIDKDDISIHLPGDYDSGNEYRNRVLLISHELSMTGAPIQLKELASVIAGLGYKPVVFSVAGGPLLYEFLDKGMVVICGEGSVTDSEWLKRLIKWFDIVFVNTFILAPLVNFFAPMVSNLFWWIHESSFLFTKECCAGIPNSPSLKIIAAGSRSRDHIEKYMDRSSYILNICIPDYGMSLNARKDKTIFLWAGILYWNKAPEVLLRAVLALPSEYLAVSEFFIVGSNNSGSAYIELLNELERQLTNIHYISEVPHDELMQIMDEVDAVVVTSIEETTSMVAVEGLMKGKTVICSDGCGIAEYLEDGEDAFIHPVNDSNILCEKIKFIIDNPEETSEIARKGRAVYERFYSEKAFKENVERLLNGKP